MLNINFTCIRGGNQTENEELQNHFHMDYELFFASSGDAEFTIENRKCKLAAGGIVLIAPGDNHKIRIEKNGQSELCRLMFAESEMPSELIFIMNEKSGHCVNGDTVLNVLFMRVGEYLQSYQGEYLNGLIRSALCEILYYFCGECAPCEFETCNKKILIVIEYIKINIAKNFVLEDICKCINRSESYLCQEFQKVMGISVMKYVRLKRTVLVQSHINKGSKPKDIYEQCGFYDYSTFFRTYKKISGLTPSLKVRKN